MYLFSAVLCWIHGAIPLAIVAGVLSPVAGLLMLYMRQLAATLVAKAYLEQQAEGGVSREDALEALRQRPEEAEGIAFDAQDVAQWPFTAMLVVSSGSLVMLGYVLILL